MEHDCEECQMGEVRRRPVWEQARAEAAAAVELAASSVPAGPRLPSPMRMGADAYGQDFDELTAAGEESTMTERADGFNGYIGCPIKCGILDECAAAGDCAALALREKHGVREEEPTPPTPDVGWIGTRNVYPHDRAIIRDIHGGEFCYLHATRPLGLCIADLRGFTWEPPPVEEPAQPPLKLNEVAYRPAAGWKPREENDV